jgi:hypothetical protein
MSETQKSWRDRHGVTVMTTVLFGLLGLVIAIQVAC